MLKLITLGGLAATRDGMPLDTQHIRKPLALLAALAANDAGVSRDRLAALFWPESDAERARGALKQAQYLIRHALGADPFGVRGSHLVLDPEVVLADVTEFQRLLTAGELAAAAALYGGPFLDGVYLRDAPEFEQLVDSERARLAGLYAHALERLACDAAQRGDAGAAVEWWRKRAELDRLSGRLARCYMESLVAASEREQAIRFGRVHAALVRQELDAEPDRQVTDYLEEMQAPPVARTQEPVSALQAEGPTTARSFDEPSATPPIPRSNARRRRLRRPLLYVLPGAAALFFIFRFVEMRPNATQRALATGTVAFFPFRVSSADSSLRFLGEGIADVLASRLQADEGPRALDAGSLSGRLGDAWRSPKPVPIDLALSAARESGAQFAVLGRITATQQHITVDARVLAVSTGAEVAVTEVAGPIDSLGSLIGHLAGSIGLITVREPEWRFTDFAQRSLETLRSCMRGRQMLREGRTDAAAHAFEDALDGDSTFALAALGAAEAGAFAVVADINTIAALRSRAVSLRGRLSRRDQLLFDALVLPVSEEKRARFELDAWRKVADALPERAEGWFEVGDRLFHEGRRLGEPDWSARAAAAFRAALDRDPGMVQARAHLAEIAALNGDLATADRWLSGFPTGESNNFVVQYTEWLVEALRAPAWPAARTAASLAQMDHAALVRVVSAAQRYGVGGGDIDRAIVAMQSRAHEGVERFADLALRHHLSLNRGDSAAAARALDVMRREDQMGREWSHSWITSDHQAVLDEIFWDGAHAAGSAAVQRLQRSLSDTTPTNAVANNATVSALALWHLSHHEIAEAARLLRVDAKGVGSTTLGAKTATLALFEATGDQRLPVTAGAVDSILALGPYEFGTEFAPLVLAKAWLRLRMPQRAVQALERRSNDWIPSTAFLSPILELERKVAGGTTDSTILKIVDRQLVAIGKHPPVSP